MGSTCALNCELESYVIQLLRKLYRQLDPRSVDVMAASLKRKSAAAERVAARDFQENIGA